MSDDIVTRGQKGSPLSHQEMDANFTALDDRSASTVKGDGTGASGTWGINVTGDAGGIDHVLSIEEGGTGAQNAGDALLALGAYPASNPASYISLQDVPDVVVTKEAVGLGNADNTSDANKPVSTPTQTALNAKEDKSNRNGEHGYPGMSGFSISLSNIAGTIRSLLSSMATSPVTYTFPNKNMTVAGLDDITGINSGTNTGDETLSTLKTKLGISVLSGINTGDQTLSSLGIALVENKTSAMIRAELTLANVTSALGFTPLDASVYAAQKGVANGVATLDSSGTLTISQIPATLLGGLKYVGTWNATLNTPTLADGTGIKGQYYVCSVAGTTSLNGVTVWNKGDWAVYNGTEWDRLEGDSSEVMSVAGRTGSIVLTYQDIAGLAASATIDATNAGNISSGTLPAARLPSFIGDVTSTGATLTLVNSGVSAGTYGDATHSLTAEFDAKGRAVSVSAVLITPSWTNIQNTPTTVAGYGITNAVTTAVLGVADGVATLGSDGKLTSTQLPAYLASGSFVASVAADAPLVSSGGSTPTISIARATGSVSGYLHSADFTTFSNKQNALGFTPVDAATLGANNGVATLDGSGKLTTSQIPASLLGGFNIQGTWNASTNTPTLANGVGTKGYLYKVSVAATRTIDGNSQWLVGDLIFFDGTVWCRIEGDSSEVISVAGRTGAVVLSSSDISGLVASATTDTTNASNISSGTLSAGRLPAFSGDITTSAGSTTTTLANTAVSAGTYGSTTQSVQITVNSQGRITSISNQTIAVTFASLSGKPVDLAGYGITDAMKVGNTFAGLAVTGTIAPPAVTGATVGTDIYLRGGAAASGTGGRVLIYGGASTSGQGGDAYMYGGTGGNGGGSLFIYGGGTTNGTYSPGNVTIQGGLQDQASGVAAGAASLIGGYASGTNAAGGTVYVQGGTGNGTAAGGNTIVRGGVSGASGTGGYIAFYTALANTLVERFRITKEGAWSIGTAGTNTGTTGQALVSAGSAAAPAWGNSFAASSFAGRISPLGYLSTVTPIASANLDLSTADFFTKTVSGNITLTLSNPPASGPVFYFMLELTNGAAGTVTWWSGITWTSASSQAAPTLSSGRDIFGFYTKDGGTTWTGIWMGKA